MKKWFILFAFLAFTGTLVVPGVTAMTTDIVSIYDDLDEYPKKATDDQDQSDKDAEVEKKTYDKKVDDASKQASEQGCAKPCCEKKASECSKTKIE